MGLAYVSLMDNATKFSKPKNVLSGKHRRPEAAEAILYPRVWREWSYDRREQFKDWRYIALQVMRKNGGIVGIMAVFEDCFDFDNCECIATDDELAAESGRCVIKTVSREVQTMRLLGLITTEPYWIQRGCKKVKGRRIRLALPADLNDVHVR